MRINPAFLSFCRTVHIYLTMLGLLVMLGFGVTGFTANHEDWFGATRPHVTESQGDTPVKLLGEPLAVVEHLRRTFHVTGALSGYETLDDRLSIGFKAPGESWEIEVEKAAGKTSIHHEAFNSIAVINNLHRGRYTGPVWSWVVDISALLIVVACVTGVVLWLALPRRRRLGVVFLAVGTALTLAIIFFHVPGQGIEPGAKAPPVDGTESSSNPTTETPSEETTSAPSTVPAR